MSEPVAIIGGAHVVRESGQRLEELVYQTARAALANAALTHADIDNVMLAASDELDGRGITSMLMSMPAAGYLKDVNKVTDSGLHALALAAMKIRCGQASNVLVMAWDGPSEAPVMEVARTALEPFAERDVGITDPMASAIQVERYLHRYGLEPDDLDKLARQRCEQAATEYDPQLVSTPLRRGHFASPVDTASALILAKDPQGRAIQGEFLAAGWRTDSYYLDQRHPPADLCRLALNDAIDKAGVSRESIEHFEIDDAAIHTEVWAAEGFGLAQSGEGPSALLSSPDLFNRRAPLGRLGYGNLSSGLMRVVRSSADAGALSVVHQAIGRGDQGQIVGIIRQGEGNRHD